MKIAILISCLSLLYFLEIQFAFFKNRPQHFQHYVKNALIGALNAGMMFVLFSGLTFHVLEWAQNHRFGLLHQWQAPAVIEWCVAFLLFDGWMYMWHRLNHMVPFLWRFHRMHHTDAELDASSAMRFHFGEIMFSTLARWMVAPFLGLTIEQLLWYEIILQPFILFHHSNVKLPERLDDWISCVIVSPNMHRIHHSMKHSELNSNYSSVLSVWDRLFASFRHRSHWEDLRYGVNGFLEQKWQGVLGMLQTPFVQQNLDNTKKEEMI